ncbi:MAG: hypothetical protein ABEJ75_03275 [Candidatus Nanohaloarchaea archaeon]
MTDTPFMGDDYGRKGRAPNPAEHEFGETYSLEEVHDDRNSLEKGLEAAHEFLTDDIVAGGSIAGTGYALLDLMYNPATFEITASNPEALQAATTAVTAVTLYNAADWLGVQSSVREAFEYVEEQFQEEGYVEAGDFAQLDEEEAEVSVPEMAEELAPEEVSGEENEVQFYDFLDDIDGLEEV